MTKELKELCGETLYALVRRSVKITDGIDSADKPLLETAVMKDRYGRHIKEETLLTQEAVDVLSGLTAKEIESRLGGIGLGEKKARTLRVALDELQRRKEVRIDDFSI